MSQAVLKRCPKCKEEIQSDAQVCKHCGYVPPVARRSGPLSAVPEPIAVQFPTTLDLSPLPKILAGLLILVAVLFQIDGYQTLFKDPGVVGGDAYNYIIGAVRGVGIICVGLSIDVIACAILLMGARQTR